MHSYHIPENKCNNKIRVSDMGERRWRITESSRNRGVFLDVRLSVSYYMDPGPGFSGARAFSRSPSL